MGVDFEVSIGSLGTNEDNAQVLAHELFVHVAEKIKAFEAMELLNFGSNSYINRYKCSDTNISHGKMAKDLILSYKTICIEMQANPLTRIETKREDLINQYPFNLHSELNSYVGHELFYQADRIEHEGYIDTYNNSPCN